MPPQAIILSLGIFFLRFIVFLWVRTARETMKNLQLLSLFFKLSKALGQVTGICTVMKLLLRRLMKRSSQTSLYYWQRCSCSLKSVGCSDRNTYLKVSPTSVEIQSADLRLAYITHILNISILVISEQQRDMSVSWDRYIIPCQASLGVGISLFVLTFCLLPV